jgi:hypothetical protein
MRDSSSLSRTATRTFCDAKSSKIQILPSPRLEFFSTIFAEFGRALAAARRYENLRHGRGRQQRRAPADLPRQIFEEFYAVERDSEDAAIAPGQSPRPALARRA